MKDTKKYDLKDKGKDIVKDHLKFESDVEDSYNLVAKENTKFINKQLFIMFLMLIGAGGFNVWVFLKLTPEQWQKIFDAGEPLGTALLAVFLLLGGVYLSTMEVHKYIDKKNNFFIDNLIKKSVKSAYSEVDENQEDWNIHIRSIAMKYLIEDKDFNIFLSKGAFRKKKYNKQYIGFEIERYCANHIDNLYQKAIENDKISNKEKSHEETNNMTNN